jgi:hypothetical protein
MGRHGTNLSRIGLTLRLNWNEMQAIRNMTPKGKKEKDFAKYCMLVGLNQVVETAKKRFEEQQLKQKETSDAITTEAVTPLPDQNAPDTIHSGEGTGKV